MSEWPRERVVVVGGGAAGMLAAIGSASVRAPTVLLEKTGRLGLKIQISGGGRCNITNDQDDPRDLARMFPGNGKFLMDAFRAFTKNDILAILARYGVATKVEPPYGKVFPVSDRSADVLEALKAELRALGVDVRLNTPVRGLHRVGGRVAGVEVEGGQVVTAGAAVICVGGLSFPKSGSTGDGYVMAREIGHRVVDTFPSLVPLRVPGTAPYSGVALRDIEGTVRVGGRPADRRFRGDVLFTHFGLSGPVVLQLSRAAADGLRQGLPVEIALDLRPDCSTGELDAELLERIQSKPRAAIGTLFHDMMPRRLVPAFFVAAGVDASRRTSEVSRADRQRLVETLRSWVFPVTGWHSMEAAEVTAGGVDVRDVDPRTFASRLVPGLYWAGEVLDVDGYVGGYNLQAAWSSGWVAGRSAAIQVLGETGAVPVGEIGRAAADPHGRGQAR